MVLNKQGDDEMTTLLYKHQVPVSVNDSATVDGDFWIPVEKMKSMTGLEVKPEGICFDDTCVPLPAQQHHSFLQENDQKFNLSAFARLLGQPVVYDQNRDVWLFGEAGSVHRNALSSLNAPDFTLPDIEGQLHTLHSFLGKKIFLVSWASW
jgi:hypothetical protein